MSQRDDLLAGAKKCLAEKGYSATTARDIVAASGAHLGSIGYHFGSKDALMNAAVLAATSEWGDTMESAVRAADAEEPSHRFATLVTKLFEAIPGERDLLVASVQAFAQADFDESMRSALAQGFREGRSAFASMMLDQKPDEIEHSAAAGLGSVVYALVTGFIVQALIDPESMPPVEDVVAGIRALVPEPQADQDQVEA
ncbi:MULTISPECIES: TetR/AcrR family transcriptional regulator [Actinoalloteichus]|uniref:Transcriptional regulator, TetR family n=1 Tax=Actinoalloteichus fjordicus TaxID=1612552 RepID=A0AAC9PU13_9PSEU|nr:MULTISPECIES: TetR/AcrR family transcriptional regulator [Actinoalloteichus]APU16595.1 transcriptional regulator, TetR family [Actinoalloteichus fjordicus]APU22661.1 transcriptional regulator, TetR family [Actinoalloteichus sp. GBA129-24]